jgi:hypothetical protein
MCDFMIKLLGDEDKIGEMHEIINKIDNFTHRLFEYQIINLSDQNAANPVNKIFAHSSLPIKNR